MFYSRGRRKNHHQTDYADGAGTETRWGVGRKEKRWRRKEGRICMMPGFMGAGGRASGGGRAGQKNELAKEILEALWKCIPH